MSNRRDRTQNRIRGPHSALTDFLAANQISARQIRDNWEERRRQAEADTISGAEEGDGDADEAEAAIARSRRRQAQEEAIEKIKKDKATMAKAKAKNKAKSKKGRRSKKKKGESEDDGDDSDYDEMVARELYAKTKPLPGQFENCEICEKRFTVTPYSKTGPDGGLICTACGKELDKDKDKGGKKKPGKQATSAAKARRKMESERMDGIVRRGAKSLVEQCMDTVVKYYDTVESFDDMPEHLVDGICRLFTKKRVMNPDTLPLFLRTPMTELVIYDSANLRTEDYNRILAQCPHLRTIIIHNAYQFKDSTIDYMVEKAPYLEHLTVYGANLVTSQKWSTLFRARGFNLRTLKLTWMDAEFHNEQVADIVKYCPNLTRLKIEHCWNITGEAVEHISKLQHLQHLSFQIMQEVDNAAVKHLITKVGDHLATLSLRSFKDVDDKVLQTIHDNCHHLKKLRISDNDCTSDAGWVTLFTDWKNPPLQVVDVNAVRDVDNQKPDGPEEAVGLAGQAFKALMEHSGSQLRKLNIASCRHIRHDVLMEVFGLGKQYPMLEDVDMSFVGELDDLALIGLFKSTLGNLKKVVVFGCFGIDNDVVVPSNVIVVGAPRVEQDGIKVFGANMDGDDDEDMPDFVRQALRDELGLADGEMELD